MTPWVSRRSALATKATGFPLAKIAAKLSVGYTLDEIKNDITKETPASFEPTLDYVVIKLPRFNFEKFKETKPVLGTQMKSVGEVMAIGRTFKEALQKGLRSLESRLSGFDCMLYGRKDSMPIEEIKRIAVEKLISPNPDRVLFIKDALKTGMTPDEIYKLSGIDRWFLNNMLALIEIENSFSGRNLNDINADGMKILKQAGFSDCQISNFCKDHPDEITVRNYRKSLGIVPVYKLVDTCAAEFQARTPYYYSTYEDEDEAFPTTKKKIMILGSGPNRIGQGIEFDYACVHCSMALQEEGFETIMVNSNPETVSTDYDISDKLYFEPLTFEDVMNIYEKEKPEGIILQFGGQTPLRLAVPLHKAGVPILGTSSDSIDIAEDRDRFKELINKLGFLQPPSATALNFDEAAVIADKVGYPILARPSYVLGGRAMLIVYDREELEKYMKDEAEMLKDGPVLIDKFLENAQEIDVDAAGDGNDIIVAGIMQHIEEAGIHSGDSAMVLPPVTLGKDMINEIIKQTTSIGKDLKIKGMMNIQFAIKDGLLYFIEVNPRASRTVPFVSKATGKQWAKIASKIISGKKISDLKLKGYTTPRHISVKEVVIPFNKFPDVDALLGPEMKSTGEVMGIDDSFGKAFIKSQIAAGFRIPKSGNILVTVNDSDKPLVISPLRKLSKLGYYIKATEGTAAYIKSRGIDCSIVAKRGEGRPDLIDEMKNGNIHMIFNTPRGRKSHYDDGYIRKTAIHLRIALYTTVQAMIALADALDSSGNVGISVKPLQEYYNQK